MAYTEQSRDAVGKFGAKPGELKGAAIALRLPRSLDEQVRTAAGWSGGSKADNARLSAWVQDACKDRVAGPAPTTAALDGYSVEHIRAAADRVAMTIRPNERLRIQKAFKALLGELLANGE